MTDPRSFGPSPSLPSGGLLCLVLLACNEFSLTGDEDREPAPLRVEDRFIQAALPGVDVLWVVDDTPSMRAKQQTLAGAARAFVEAMDAAGLAWQAGVVRSTLGEDDAGVLHGNPWVIVPGLPDPAGELAQAAQVGANGAEPSGGLGAALLALSDPLAEGPNRGFRRPDAALHIVVFSDGDDESESVLGADPVAATLGWLAEEARESGRAAALSAVVGDAGAGCVGAGGQAVPGDRYLAVAAATGGATASICDADLEPVLTEIGAATAEWPRSFALQGMPEAGSARVWVNDQRENEGWDIIGAALTFDLPPPPDAEIRVSYVLAASAPDTGGP